MHLNIGGTAEWGHVCLPKQLDAGNRTMVADTVCRQLGYTNSLIIIDDTKYVTFMSLQLPIRNEIKSTSYTLYYVVIHDFVYNSTQITGSMKKMKYSIR